MRRHRKAEREGAGEESEEIICFECKECGQVPLGESLGIRSWFCGETGDGNAVFCRMVWKRGSIEEGLLIVWRLILVLQTQDSSVKQYKE